VAKNFFAFGSCGQGCPRSDERRATNNKPIKFSKIFSQALLSTTTDHWPSASLDQKATLGNSNW
jgi:hypothetical protein